MAKMIGQYVVTDPKICHGTPTFRGTRIMVHQVLNMVAQEMPWEEIIYECHGRITREAIAEAIALASQIFDAHADEYLLEPRTA